MPSMSDLVVCFDLDDTLYKEIDYLKSAYLEIAETVGHPEAAEQMVEWYKEGKNAFEELIKAFGLDLTIADFLKIYRNHYPEISLEEGVMEYLEELKDSGAKLGVITDGRSVTQRNKIRALGIERMLDAVIISEEIGSEKPDVHNYQAVMNMFPERKVFVYVGDNTKKDFIAPNALGWRTYCVKNDGRNIHGQDFSMPREYMPQHVVSSIKDIIL